jgi:serine/threonine protein kinase
VDRLLKKLEAAWRKPMKKQPWAKHRWQARFGTPGYLAPELVNEKLIAGATSVHDIFGTVETPAADVFSQGTVLLELCCLENPLGVRDTLGLAYEAVGVKSKEAWTMYTTAMFIPSRNSSVREWGELYTALLSQVNVEKLLSESSLRVPNEFVRLIRKMLAVAPNDRPQDGMAVVARLVEIEKKHVVA